MDEFIKLREFIKVFLCKKNIFKSFCFIQQICRFLETIAQVKKKLYLFYKNLLKKFVSVYFFVPSFNYFVRMFLCLAFLFFLVKQTAKRNIFLIK